MVSSALLVGLGNIGCKYDLESEEILTHLKAMVLSNSIKTIHVYDSNLKFAKIISKEYNVQIETELSTKSLMKYDLVVIATPTNFHFKILQDCLKNNNQTIICEKPISYKLNEIDSLSISYKKSQSTVIINYFRRFLNGYINLKKTIKKSNNKLRSVNIRYSRGLINNCSHALDLIEFLTDESVQFSKINFINKINFTENDNTLSCIFKSGEVDYFLDGRDENYGKFEIDLKFENYKVKIYDRGNCYEILDQDNNIIKKSDNTLYNYMHQFYSYLFKYRFDKKICDNFTNSILLNKKLIKNFIHER